MTLLRLGAPSRYQSSIRLSVPVRKPAAPRVQVAPLESWTELTEAELPAFSAIAATSPSPAVVPPVSGTVSVELEASLAVDLPHQRNPSASPPPPPPPPVVVAVTGVDRADWLPALSTADTV